MAKKPNITTIASGYYSRQALNSNFEDLRDAFDNTLSLDGSTPNALQADIDLNGNNIIGASGLFINGSDYLSEVEAARSEAQGFETQAAASAVAAAASETSAAGHEAASAASAASAATSFDDFQDIYLGAKAAEPAVDNDGDPLVSGALYFDTLKRGMRVYDGTSWVSASTTGGASLDNFVFTATAGQTVFTGVDDNAKPLSYTVNSIIVTLNGVSLKAGIDYTATDASSIVLTAGAATGDGLHVVAFKSFSSDDLISASIGGTFTAPVTFSAGMAAASVTSTGVVTAASMSSTGAVTAASVSSTGAVTAASVSSTGAVTAASISDGTDTVETGYVVNGSAKAWINFNGTGTVAIRDSLNVSSVRDNGVGDQTLVYTNKFTSNSFSVTGGSKSDAVYPPDPTNFNNHLQLAIPQATGGEETICYFGYYTAGGGSFLDADQIYVAAHGDLA